MSVTQISDEDKAALISLINQQFEIGSKRLLRRLVRVVGQDRISLLSKTTQAIKILEVDDYTDDRLTHAFSVASVFSPIPGLDVYQGTFLSPTTGALPALGSINWNYRTQFDVTLPGIIGELVITNHYTFTVSVAYKVYRFMGLQ